MDNHLTRWVSQLANVIVVMTTYIGQSPDRSTVLGLAERLEELAANVRSRAPKNSREKMRRAVYKPAGSA